MRTLDVGIIGAGTAGSAAATFLARAGHRVTLYERVQEPTAIGAGITLQPTGLHVLARLGLREAVVSRGSRIERLTCRTPGGRTVVDLNYTSIDPSLFGLGLHRGVLFEALFDAARAEPITLVTGVEIVTHERVGRRWALVDAAARRHGLHELVIVADGARSQFRDHSGPEKSVTTYPWGALWAVVPDTRAASDPRRTTIHQIAHGNRKFLGLLPTGFGPGDRHERLVSVFWSLRRDEVDAWRARGIDAWRSEALALAPEAAALLEPIRHERDMLFATYHDVVMRRWSSSSVVYLGDAAHATSPQLGQGCNLALWDAMVLADVLAEEPHHLDRALHRYDHARKDHLAYYQVATRSLTPFFQGDVALLGVLRDALMPLCQRVPFMRRMMTEAMLGLSEGFLGGSLSLASVGVRAPGLQIEAP